MLTVLTAIFIPWPWPVVCTAAATAGIFDLLSAFIASVGFPIAAFLIMVKLNKDQTAAHKEEMTSLKSVLEANTAAIDRLGERLSAIEKVVDKLDQQ